MLHGESRAVFAGIDGSDIASPALADAAFHAVFNVVIDGRRSDALAVEAIAYHHHHTRIPHFGFDNLAAIYVANLLAHELETHLQGSTGAELFGYYRACLETLGILPRLAEFRELASKVAI
jgi:hypothetical protein